MKTEMAKVNAIRSTRKSGPFIRMQPGSLVRIFSRQGQNTPAALYWGRELPAWRDGETITLLDSTGQVQSTFRVGETQPLFPEATPG